MNENPSMYDKLAKKIRTQANRIIELEAEILEERKQNRERKSSYNNAQSKSLQEELLVTRKKNDLLSQENTVLREKIDVLQKSLS